MGLFTNKNFDSLEDLFVEQIEDLYDAEIRLTKALPKMAEASERDELKTAFTKHLRETEVHVERLERIFAELGKDPRREACEGIKGLISEGNEMVSANGDSAARDAGIIAAAQRVEHYEMAGYGTARAMAEHLGHDDAARLLQATLDEEMAADKKLTEIAEGSIYGKKAKKASGARGSEGKSNGRMSKTRTENARKKTSKSTTRSQKSKGRKKAVARGK